MKKQLSKTKKQLYLLLTVLTVFFAFMSYCFFSDDLESRTIPQVKRAIVQVSQLLPKLEENEQALREVYDSLETNRRLVYQNNDDILEEHESNDEDVENLIDNTLAWMNRVTGLRVGRQGHVTVISREDNTILAHPDKQFIGEVLRPLGKVDMDAIPDISEITPDNISEDFHYFFPSSFFREDVSFSRFFDAADAGLFGAVFAYKDTYILCGTTLREAISFIIVRSFFITLFFFAVAWVLIHYIGFSLNWYRIEKKEFSSKLSTYATIAAIILFAVFLYYNTMMDITGDYSTMNNHARVAVETLNTYRTYRDELSDWLDDQYLEQCRLAVELVKGRGKENLTRKEVDKFANELGVKYIYVFDKTGKVFVTNSPYDHFQISNNEEDQSYAFLPLLDGREYVIQDPMGDESSGEKMQYIGVSLRDENDLADGFVQIAIDPQLRDSLLEPISIQAVLDNLVIGLPEHALAIDKETLQIVATTGLAYKDTNIAEYGLEADSLKNNYSGFFMIGTDIYYAGVSESEDLYLMPIVKNIDDYYTFSIAILLTLISAGAFFLFYLVTMHAYQKILAFDALEKTEVSGVDEYVEKDADSDKNTSKHFLFRRIGRMIKVKDKFGFDTRWKKQRAIPIEEQTPEMRTGTIIYKIILVFAIALILSELYLYLNSSSKESLDGFSFVLFGNWERGVNMFSISFCMFLLALLYVIQELLNQVLYRIAKVSELKTETILLLLRNALKYTCALVFLYMGLAKFGIDTRTLWASAGVLSLVVGLGAKDLISDVISGLFIIFEGTYKIGDFVTIGSWSGLVEEIGLRYTKVGLYSDTKIFNNSSIRDFINYQGEAAKEVLKFPVPYEIDLLEIEKLLKRELPNMAKNIPGLLGAPKYQGVNAFEPNGMILRIKIMCVPSSRRKARRAFLRELKLLFDREGIRIPYNHMVVMDYKDAVHTYTFTPEDEEDV